MFTSFFKAGPGEEEKKIVAGEDVDDSAKVYPVSIIHQRKNMTVTFGGKKVTLTYDETTDHISVKTSLGQEIEAILSY